MPLYDTMRWDEQTMEHVVSRLLFTELPCAGDVVVLEHATFEISHIAWKAHGYVDFGGTLYPTVHLVKTR